MKPGIRNTLLLVIIILIITGIINVFIQPDLPAPQHVNQLHTDYESGNEASENTLEKPAKIVSLEANDAKEEKISSEVKKNKKCDTSHIANMRKELSYTNDSLSDNARDELLMLTGSDTLVKPEIIDRDSDEYKNNRDRLSARRMELLKEQYDEVSDELTAISILEECDTTKVIGLCNDDLIDRLANQHSQNAFIWMYVASIYSDTDSDKLQYALQQILTSNEFRTNRQELTRSIHSFLQAQGATPTSTIFKIYGIEAGRSLPMGSLKEYCNKIGNPATCLTLGQTLERQGEYAIYELIGMAIQIDYWVKLQDKDAVESITKRKDDLLSNFQKNGLHEIPSADESINILLNSLDHEREIDTVKYQNDHLEQFIAENPDVCVL